MENIIEFLFQSFFYFLMLTVFRGMGVEFTNAQFICMGLGLPFISVMTRSLKFYVLCRSRAYVKLLAGWKYHLRTGRSAQKRLQIHKKILKIELAFYYVPFTLLSVSLIYQLYRYQVDIIWMILFVHFILDLIHVWVIMGVLSFPMVSFLASRWNASWVDLKDLHPKCGESEIWVTNVRKVSVGNMKKRMKEKGIKGRFLSPAYYRKNLFGIRKQLRGFVALIIPVSEYDKFKTNEPYLFRWKS